MAKLTVEMNPKMDEILSELARDKQTSKVEVLRRAVALYKYIDGQLADGKKALAIAQDDEILKEIVVP